MVIRLIFTVLIGWLAFTSQAGAADIGTEWEHYSNTVRYFPNGCQYTPNLDEAIAQTEAKQNNDYAYCHKPEFGYECKTVVQSGAVCSLNQNFYVQTWIRQKPTCETGTYNPETYQCEADPSECEEIGQFYNPENKSCTPECDNGALFNQCLEDLDPDDSCNSDHPDYKGTLGWGEDAQPVCRSQGACDDDHTFGVSEYEKDGVKTTVLSCIANDYNPPECSGSMVLVVNEFGPRCVLPEDADKYDPDEDEEPNTDTDGDGEPDEYRPENDPAGTNKQLGQIVDALNTANAHLKNIENKPTGGGGGGSGNNGDAGEGLKDENGDDYLADIEANTADTVTQLENLNNGLKAPGDLTGGDDTFGGLTGAFQDRIGNAPILNAVNFSNVSGSCPTYTIDISEIGLGSYQLNYHCQFADQYGPWLGGLFLALYALIGIRIFTSA